MDVKIGDLAIAKFNSGIDSGEFDELVCIVTGNNGVEMTIMYWEIDVHEFITVRGSLPQGRLTRVKIKDGLCPPWNGSLACLEVEDVVPCMT